MKSAKLWLSVLLLMSSQAMNAVVAYPGTLQVRQQDGSVLQVRMVGDEYFHYMVDMAGNLVEKGEDGFYHYVEMKSDGSVTVSPQRMALDRPKTTRLSLPQEALERAKTLRSHEVSQMRMKSPMDNTPYFNAPFAFTKSLTDSIPGDSIPLVSEDTIVPSAPMTWQESVEIDCNRRSLVILVRFSDYDFVVKDPQAAFDSLLNMPGYASRNATGSARDYYIDNSSGIFRPKFDVFGPFTLPRSMAEYGGNEGGADVDHPGFAKDAIAAAYSGGVDFSKYDSDNNGILDNVFIFYAGYSEAEGGPSDCIWPHSSSLDALNIYYQGLKVRNYACTSELRGYTGDEMAGIGVFCHEYGHTLGLPDLYDTDYAASGGESLALGITSLMAEGTYNNDTRTPPHLNAEELCIMGWASPLTLNEGHLEIPSIESNVFYRHDTDTPDEYFLFENRQQTGWDTYLPGHGLLIYHVDRSTTTVYSNMSAMFLWAKGGINNYPPHECMDLLEADGKSTAGAFFPGAEGRYRTFSYSTQPSFKAWNGIKSPYRLTDISEAEGVISTEVVYEPVLSTISGYVRDEVSRAGLPQVPLTITHLASSKVYNVTTDSRGYFEIKLPIGRYRISAKMTNYRAVNELVNLYEYSMTSNINLPRLPCVERHSYKKVHICASEFPFMYAGSLFTEPGEYDFHYLVPPFDCDSTHTLVLTATYIDTTVIQIKNVLSIADTTASCQWMYLSENEGWMDVEGATERSYAAVRNGCYAAWLTKDSCSAMTSICTVDCFCENLFEQFDTMTVCASELPLLYRDSTLEQAGDYQFHYYTARLKCDSMYYLHLIVPEFDTVVVQEEMLLQSADSTASYQWMCMNAEGEWEDISGATDSLFAAERNGLYAVRLTKSFCSVMSEVSMVDCFCENLFTQHDTLTVCASEFPFSYRDSVLERPGDYKFHYYTSRLGCDSIYYLHLDATVINELVYQSGNILTSADTDASYQWMSVREDGTYQAVEGAVSRVFTALTNGWYVLHLEKNHCSKYSALIQVDNICEGPYFSFDTLLVSQNELPFVYLGTLIDSPGVYEFHYQTEPYHCDSSMFLTVLTTQINTHVDVRENILTSREKSADYQWMKYDKDNHLKAIDGAVNSVYEALSNGRYVLKLTKDGFTDWSDVLTVDCFCQSPYYSYDTLIVRERDLPVKVEGQVLSGPGRYEFVHSGRFGCDSIRVLQLNLLDGISNPVAEADYSVVPNPTDGFLVVHHPGAQGRIVVRDLLGIKLKEFDAPSDPTSIVLDVPAGMYFVIFENSSKRFVRSVIKQ